MSYVKIVNSLKRGINVDTGMTHYVFGPDFDLIHEGYDNTLAPYCQPGRHMSGRTLVETKMLVKCQRCLKKLLMLTKAEAKTKVELLKPRPPTLGDKYRMLFSVGDKDGKYKLEFNSYNSELIAMLRETIKRSTLPDEFKDDDVVLIRLAGISDWPR